MYTYTYFRVSFFFFFFLFTLLVHTSLACHPECTYQCDDPVCKAVCNYVVVRNVNCNVQCNGSYTPLRGQCFQTPACHIIVPDDQCESDSCPVAQVQCGSVYCNPAPPRGIVCSTLCEEVELAWKCRKPTIQDGCREPICELQCEQPACAATSDGVREAQTHSSLLGHVMIILLYLMITH
jgi:hypothetical protein